MRVGRILDANRAAVLVLVNQIALPRSDSDVELLNSFYNIGAVEHRQRNCCRLLKHLQVEAAECAIGNRHATREFGIKDTKLIQEVLGIAADVNLDAAYRWGSTEAEGEG